MSVVKVQQKDLASLRNCGVRADKKDTSWRCNARLTAPKDDEIARMVGSYLVIAYRRGTTVDAWLTYVPSGRIGWLIYDTAKFDTAVPPLVEEVVRQCGTAFGYIENYDARERMKALGYDVDDDTHLVSWPKDKELTE